jgi:hypothetical protein
MLKRLDSDAHGELGLFAFGETVHGRLPLTRIQLKVIHNGAGGGDFPFRHPAIGLGDMAHHLERGGVKYVSSVIMAVRPRRRFLLALIEVMTRRCTQQCAQWPTDHKTKSSAKQFS